MSELEHDRQFRLYSHCICGAELIWVKHETSGRWAALEADPVPAEGLETFVLRGDLAIAVPPSVFAEEEHYVLHRHEQRRTA